jgi:cytochrome P450
MSATVAAESPAHVPAAHVVDFDIYAPEGVEGDYHAAWLALQKPGLPPIVWTPRNGGHWIAARGKVIGAVFADHEKFSSRVIVLPKSDGELHSGLIPTTIDPPAHRGYRSLLNSSFSPRAVAGLEARVRETAAALVEGLAPKGRCNFTEEYAAELPIRIFMELAGLPLADAPRLKFLTDQVTRPDGQMSFADALHEISAYMGPKVDERRERPREDMLSRIVNGDIDGRKLTRDEAVIMTTQVMIAGLDTVVNFLGFAMLFLAREPQMRRRLAADVTLIPAAVDELFRRYPIVTVAREVTSDMTYEGANLKRGDMIALPTALHGTDAAVHADPLHVDLARADRTHSTFGNGVHRCPGAQLARAEIRITIEEWLKRIPAFEVEPGAEIRYASGIVGTVLALPLVWGTS